MYLVSHYPRKRNIKNNKMINYKLIKLKIKMESEFSNHLQFHTIQHIVIIIPITPLISEIHLIMDTQIIIFHTACIIKKDKTKIKLMKPTCLKNNITHNNKWWKTHTWCHHLKWWTLIWCNNHQWILKWWLTHNKWCHQWVLKWCHHNRIKNNFNYNNYKLWSKI